MKEMLIFHPPHSTVSTSTCSTTLETPANHTCSLSSLQKYGRHGNTTSATITHSGHFNFLKSRLKNVCIQNSLLVFTPPRPPFSLSILVILPAIDLQGAWPGLLMCCRAELVRRGRPEKELCAASADHLTQPLPASDPLLTGSPCVPRPKKAQTEGFSAAWGRAQDLIHPPLSPTLLSQSPTPASGWLYSKNSKIPPPPQPFHRLRCI